MIEMSLTPDQAGRIAAALPPGVCTYRQDTEEDADGVVVPLPTGTLFIPDEHADAVAALDPDAPAPVPVVVTRKADIWRRCSDAEAVEIEAAIAGTSAKLRGIFSAETNLRSDDDRYLVLVDIATGLFGEARAAELLAPST